MKIRCLSVLVYRFPLGDCTNSGVSSRNDRLLIPCSDGPDVVDTEIGLPDNFCHIEHRKLFGGDVYSIRPADVVNGEIVDRGGKWYMDGGNFAHTSDSRFHRLVGGMYGAVAIHDRVEEA